MTAETLIRCRCGDPMLANGTCGHCDRGQCNSNHTAAFPGGLHCSPKHNWDTCPRCQTLGNWLPQPGEFDDLPYGYRDNS